jgi:hypothetical protein
LLRNSNLQNFRRRRSGQVLVELGDELRVPLALLAKQVELLLLVAESEEDTGRVFFTWGRTLAPKGNVGP